MKKIDIKGIIIIVTAIIAIAVLYATFSTQIDNKLNLNKESYPLATVDILSEIRQDLNLTAVGNPSIFASAQFDISTFSNTPKEAPVYKYQESNLLKQENELNLIKTLGFQKVEYTPKADPILGRSISVSNEDASLSIYTNQGMMAYSKNITWELSYFPSVVDTTTYIEKATNYLTSIGIDLSSFTFSRIKYYSVVGPEADEVYSPQRAKIIEVMFLAKVSNFPIIDNSTETDGNLVRVWLDVNKNLIRADYQSTGEIGEKTGVFKLKTKDQILRDINSGRLKIIKTDTSLLGQEIKTTKIQSLKLGYYAINGILTPVYILQGMSTTANGLTGNTNLIMEAVEK